MARLRGGGRSHLRTILSLLTAKCTANLAIIRIDHSILNPEAFRLGATSGDSLTK